MESLGLGKGGYHELAWSLSAYRTTSRDAMTGGSLIDDMLA